jgi:hypothetical protein
MINSVALWAGICQFSLNCFTRARLCSHRRALNGGQLPDFVGAEGLTEVSAQRVELSFYSS